MDKREVVLDLLARDKTGPATKSAASNLDAVAGKADKAADAAGQLGTASEVAEDGVEKLGKSARTAAEHVEHLDREIESVEHELQQLAVAFAEAETAADRLDLSKAIRRTEADLRKLSKSRGLVNDLIPSIEEEVAGSGGRLKALGSKLGSTIGGSVGTSAGVVAGPLILSAVGGAISAGAGAAGIGAGIGLAIATDPALKAAGKELGKNLFDQAGARARTAFRDPVMDIFGDLGRYGTTIVDQWGDAFDKLAPAARPFVDTVLDAVTDLSGVITDIAGDSGPALSALGDGFDEVADSVGGALRRITGDVDRNADSLEVLFGVVSTTIDVFGLLAEGVEFLAEPLILAYKGADALGKAIGNLAQAAGAADEPLNRMRALHIDSAGAMDQTSTAAYDEVAALKSLAAEQKALADPTFALVKAQDDLAKAQSDINKAQEEHGKSSPEYRAALRDAAEAALELQSAASEVATTSTGRLDPALRATLEAAGLTKGQISALEKEFGDAKRSGDRFARTYAATVKVNGLEQAKATAKRIEAVLDAIRDENVNINYTTSTGENSSRLRANYKKGMASGGAVNGPGPKGVDSEPRLLAPGEHIWTAAEVDAAGGQAAVARMRAAVLSRGGGAASAAFAGASTVGVAGGAGIRGVTFTFDFGLSDLGQLMAKSLRTQPAVATAVAAAIRPYITTVR